MPSLRATGELAPHAHPFQVRGGPLGLPKKCALPSIKEHHVASLAATTTSAGDVAQITRQSAVPGVPPLLPFQTGCNIVTPIRVHSLAPLLKDYDPHLCNYIISGITHGFSIGAIGTLPIFDIFVRNLQSAFQLPQVIDTKIHKELALGRILGPYPIVPPLPNYRISPLGVVPNKVPGEFRVIHHLSYPQGASINDAIPREFSSVTYSSIQDAITMIKSSSATVYMAKFDVESAFRILPIAPTDRPLLGFRLRGLFYMDVVLPMGCSSSCVIFEAFSDALHWLAQYQLSVSCVVHFLDDFLFLAPSKDKYLADMQAFRALLPTLAFLLHPARRSHQRQPYLFLILPWILYG